MRPALANIITARVPEADLLIDTMTVRPQGNRAFLISDTIRRLKAADIWAKLDVLWMLAAHDAQAARLNWKAPASFALTEVNSPTFTVDRGYAGNGTTSYLDTGWAPSTNAVNFTQDSASLGVRLAAGTDVGNNAAQPFGGSPTNGAFVAPRSISDTLRGRVNQSASADIGSAGSITTRLGLTALDRSASTVVTGYRNGASLGTVNNASVALDTATFFICAQNNGTPFAPVDNRISTAFAGASFSGAVHAALHSIMQTYMNRIGA
jgi:hypothetical protein